MGKPDINLMTRTENLSGIDLNIAEMQSMEGYVPTFLSEHRGIMSINTNPNIPHHDKRSSVSDSVYYMVSLITDIKLRETLWEWIDAELKARLDQEPDASQDRKLEIRYSLSCILQGKIMDFVGRHLTKPVEIGTE